MTWSYLPDLTTLKDQVRLLVGDTFFDDQQFQDEEIAFFLTQRSSVYGAAAEAARSLAAKFGRSVDYAAGDTSVKYSQMAKSYLAMAAGFETKATTAGSGMPYAGGIGVADKIQQQSNSDRVQPQFQVGMNDDNIPLGDSGNEALIGTRE